jgi:hypothetical protein
LYPTALADGLPHLLGDAAGHSLGRDPPGLGVADQPVDPPAGRQAELGDLGGFARAGVAGDDHHGMPLNRGDDLVLFGLDGQVLRKNERRQRFGALGSAIGGLDEHLLDPGEFLRELHLIRGSVTALVQLGQPSARSQAFLRHDMGQQPVDGVETLAKFLGPHGFVMSLRHWGVSLSTRIPKIKAPGTPFPQRRLLNF